MSMTEQLLVRMGNKLGESFRVMCEGATVTKTRAEEYNIVDGVIAPGWTSLFVLTGRSVRDEKKYRFFQLVPAEKEATLAHGVFFVKGRFRVITKINNAREAREAWSHMRSQAKR